jgi:hypothetical protein
MRVSEFTVENETDLSGSLQLTIEHNTEEYTIDFEFNWLDSPKNLNVVPTGSKEIYAWPTEEIPAEIKFQTDTEEAAELLFGLSGLPDGITLLPDHYTDVDSKTDSPFVIQQ